MLTARGRASLRDGKETRRKTPAMGLRDIDFYLTLTVTVSFFDAAL